MARLGRGQPNRPIIGRSPVQNPDQPAAVSLAGSGGMGASAQVAASAGAALLGAGSLAADTLRDQAAGAGLIGTGALSSAAVTERPGAAGLAGRGALTANQDHSSTAALSGGGSFLAAAAVQPGPGSAVLVGAGGLLATGQGGQTAAALLGGGASLSVAAGQGQLAAAVLVSGGALTAVAVRVSFPAAGVVGAGSLLASAVADRAAALVVIGSGALTAGVVGGQPGAAILVGAASLGGAATVDQVVAAALAGSGSITGAAFRGHSTSTVLASGGALTAATTRVPLAVAALIGSGSLTAVAMQAIVSGGALTGGGALTAAGLREQLVTASLAGRGSLFAAAVRVHLSATALTGRGVFLAGADVQAAPDHSRSQLGLPARVRVQPTRVIAQNILTGQFLHWELPVDDLAVTFSLSGPQVITGSFPTELRDLRDVNLEPWGTWIHVEEGGLIRASGILQPSSVDQGETLSLEAVGVSAYAAGIPFEGAFTLAGPSGAVGVQIDPADIVRAIWAELQSYPDAKLGVQVTGSTTVRVGTPAEDVSITTGTGATSNFTAGPYSALDWWESRDCGSEIDTLAKSTPFDFTERCQWNATKTAVDHFIDIGFPRSGRRLTEVRFAQDENLLAAIGPEETDDLYASQVILLGSGEGSARVRGYAGRPMGTRLRRVAVIDKKDEASTARANALSRSELDRRNGAALRDVTEITTKARHPNAPLGSFQPGDEALLTARVPWAGEIRQYQRVLSYTYSPSSEAIRITMRNAASFSYGASG